MSRQAEDCGSRSRCGGLCRRGAGDILSSKMAVVGSMKNTPTEKDKGANLLGLLTRKPLRCRVAQGQWHGRPPMTGEFGWQGGVIANSKTDGCSRVQRRTVGR